MADQFRLGSVLIGREEIRKIVNAKAREIDKYYTGLGVETVKAIVVLTGAMFYGPNLLLALGSLSPPGSGIRWQVDTLSVGSYGKGVVSSGDPKMYKDIQKPINGQNVIIVEDIVDTGQTLDWVIRNLQTHNPASIEVTALLRKPSRTIVEVNPRFVGMDIEDRFVVGYGLDLADDYRNLPDIHVMEALAAV